MPTQKQQAYQSYLLRLWRENHDGPRQWRASLESAQTGEIHRFASVEALFAFINQQVVPENRNQLCLNGGSENEIT